MSQITMIEPGRRVTRWVLDTTRNQEQRLRRRAKRRWLILRKSRRRTPAAHDYGTWYIIDPDTNGLIAECKDLNEVEVVLSRSWEALVTH